MYLFFLFLSVFVSFFLSLLNGAIEISSLAEDERVGKVKIDSSIETELSRRIYIINKFYVYI